MPLKLDKQLIANNQNIQLFQYVLVQLAAFMPTVIEGDAERFCLLICLWY